MEKLILKNKKILIIIVSILSIVFLHASFKRHQKIEFNEAKELAWSLQALLDKSELKKIEASNIELYKQTKEYSHLKDKLVLLTESNSKVHYAYIAIKDDNETYAVIDSNPSLNSDYSPLDNLDKDWLYDITKEGVRSKVVTNQWGSWIRVIIPVKDKEEVISVLGLSYSAKEWNKEVFKNTLPDIITTINIYVVLIALMLTATKYIELKHKSKKLAFDEKLYRSLFEQIPIGFSLNEYNIKTNKFTVISANPMMKQIFGEGILDAKNLDWMKMLSNSQANDEIKKFTDFINNKISGYSVEREIKRLNGDNMWINLKVASFSEKRSKNFIYLSLVEDITNKKKTEMALKESERSKDVFLSNLPGMAYRVANDKEWTILFASEGTKELTGYDIEDVLYNKNISYENIIAEEYRDLVRKRCNIAIENKKKINCEYEIVTKDNKRKWVLEVGQGIYNNGISTEIVEGIILDITEQKDKEDTIAYLITRDSLTSLYNREYIYERMLELNEDHNKPYAIALCDINGLRLINEAYSFEEGDKMIIDTANLLKDSCIEDNILLGRSNGGEFIILMQNINELQVARLIQNIKANIDEFNINKEDKLYEINVTIEYAIMKSKEEYVIDVLKRAETYLKHSKLLNQKSLHYSVLSTIMATLYAKSQETQEHGERLGDYAYMIGREIGLSKKELDDLKLLSMLHDIGKIGIKDEILNKPGKLTQAEWIEMKKHPEIGAQIVRSVPQLTHISEGILHHHEWWDGTGYPNRLKGEEILLISRILSIADAYDAMTEDRVYRKALPVKEALGEIKRGAGSQFDPNLAKLFISLIG